jgi:hypothetical protein
LRDDLVPEQCGKAMAALPNGDVLVGTSIEAGTGGTAVATQAMLYRIDWKTKKRVETWPIDPGAAQVRDLVTGPDGRVYGLTGKGGFFVFDPRRGRIIHQEQLTRYGGVTGSQAPRVMAIGPDGKLYMLFHDAIARVDLKSFQHSEAARPGVPVHTGIAIAQGRLYFASGTHICSVRLFEPGK